MEAQTLTRKYLQENKTSLRKFGRLLQQIDGDQYSAQRIHQWAKGICNPSLVLLLRAQANTEIPEWVRSWASESIAQRIDDQPGASGQ